MAGENFLEMDKVAIGYLMAMSVRKRRWKTSAGEIREVDAGRKDREGKSIVAPKYTGMHTLRHFYASWCINRQTDEGLCLPPKSVQERLGHSYIVITMDTYGHLFPRCDDGKELAAAEAALLG